MACIYLMQAPQIAFQRTLVLAQLYSNVLALVIEQLPVWLFFSHSTEIVAIFQHFAPE